ncbi:cytochrome c [Chitinophaga eiseniae]|uniref:Cytochrome c n=1 Tax=Chitinophaga eiseniae TaxID=634771 RepID=A0A1T4T121_9BACT|nr:PQQ-dependent sugar dehydrogenase [Chitinophaga eiseniae]SKA34039.1 cytochrome c [Chitinophaga eiseniae]
MKKLWLPVLLALLTACGAKRSVTRILCYTKNTESAWVKQLQEAGQKEGWQIVLTGDRQYFQDDSLKNFSAVCVPFSLTDSLNYRDIPALKRYAEAGGGGILAVKDSGAVKQGWPWLREWNTLPENKALEQDKGRLYILPATAAAATIQPAIRYLVGNNAWPDYNKTLTIAPPDTNRYTYTVLDHGLDEPMELAILPGGNVLFVERKGAVKMYDAHLRQTKTIGRFDVFSGIEDGLLGVALDPHYEKNHWVYFYYAPAGEKWYNKLVRLELHGDTLDMSSEKVLMEVPTQRRYCCHSAGYLFFGPQDLLYLSIGDNTNAEETHGYTPVDERAGRELSDDQASSANSMDLRGKILRIKPEPDGTYAIPDGNLFPKDGSKGRPEIYVMGCRNPYRFSVDMKNAFVYWGDVGPDTKVPSAEGSTLSFDEINQAKKPGFFGWPYFNGNNEAYPLLDYATMKERPGKDPMRPVNNSPHNTGIKELPPAQPALIWYGDAASPVFPMVGKGGETAMAGPVFYADHFKDAPYKLSNYYDGKLFIYEWMRHWIMAVTLDSAGNYLRMEPFLENIDFAAPTDMQFAPDGSIYMLEYGTNWFSKNSNAKLVRITYSEGNRQPVANIRSSQLYGGAPLTVKFSANGSVDYDKGDKLTYTWKIGDQQLTGEQVEHTFTKPGVYKADLTVSDDHGGKGTSSVDIKVGNTPPDVKIFTSANKSFYWDNAALDYKVMVTDPEDGTPDSSKIKITFDYLPMGKDFALVLANNGGGNTKFAKGHQLFWSLDCKSCHTENTASIGPSLLEVAKRYPDNETNVNKLAEKIIAGGSGSWGNRTMSAHPDMSAEDAREIVHYILSLSSVQGTLPMHGVQPFKAHAGKGTEGGYLLMATYTDKGANNIEPITGREYIMLKNPRVQAEDFDEGNVSLITITTANLAYTAVRNNSYMRFNRLYMDGVKSLQFNVQEQGIGGVLEIRLDKQDGPLAGQVAIKAGNAAAAGRTAGWKTVTAAVQPVTGQHDLYFVFKSADGKDGYLFNIDWIHFSNNN